jgi:D,D-heptose 1,7-bisphosphate phosphatase
MKKDFQIKQAVILAGGLGSRLRKITKEKPKPLVKVLNKSFIEYLFFNLSRHGFNKLLILCSYKSILFFKKYHKKKYYNLEILCINENSPMGTGGALINAKKFLDKFFLLCNGDTYFDINLNDLTSNFDKKKMLLLLAVTTPNYKNRFTKLNINKKNGLVRKVNLKTFPQIGYVNAGYYICSKKILSFIKKECSLEKNIFPLLINHNKLYARIYENSFKKFLDIGVPKDFYKAKNFINRNLFKPAIFLDRDGVINKDLGYVIKKKDIIWKKDIFKFVKYYNDKGYYVFVATNQSGIGRGFYSEKKLLELHDWMNNKFRSKGAHIDKFYYAPYFKDSINLKYRKGSKLRKPNKGMIDLALKEWNINLKKSKFFGDREVDRIVAKNSNLNFELVKFYRNFKY